MWPRRAAAISAVVVDACSTGSFYPECLPAGSRCLHVQSAADPPPLFRGSFNPRGYLENVIFDGDMAALVQRVRAFEPRLILAGSELGVELGERLLAHFPELLQNLPRPAGTRRDKHLMARCVEEAGVAVMPQLQTDRGEEAVRWAEQRGEWPVVVKDALGSGGCGLRICPSAVEVRAAFAELLGTRNDLNVPVRALLVQPFLVGEEYAVNTVSGGGRHYVTDVMRYVKQQLPSGRQRLLGDELLPYEAVAALPGLLAYACAVLDALGIVSGPAHTEIMMTAHGPRLIESAARPGGGCVAPQILRRCVGHSQLDVSLLAQLDVDAFAAYAQRPYQLKQHMSWVSLIAERSGRVKALRGMDEVRALASFAAVGGLVEVGAQVRATVDLDSVAGMVVLAHPERAQVQADYRRLRELERRGLIVMEGEGEEGEG